MLIEPRRLHQAHHHGLALASEFAAGKQPRPAYHCPRLDLPLQVVVVDRDCGVLKVVCQRGLVAERVVDGTRH